jgi:hypothetical protein
MRARPLLVLFLILPLGTASAQSFPRKLSVCGDSLSQGALADGVVPYDQPWNSWAHGSNSAVGSMLLRYRAYVNRYMVAQPVSKSGATIDDFPGQAAQVCSQWIRPNRVFVLLGQNDACRSERSPTEDAAALMPTAEYYASWLRAGLDRLAACLPSGSVVHVVSVIRVDFLRDAGMRKDPFFCPIVWDELDICPIVTDEPDPARRWRVGERIDEWNAALAQEVTAFHFNLDGRNPRRINFVTDWEGSITQGKSNTSAGTYNFISPDINQLDCFHASIRGQAKLACLQWAKSVDGSGSAAECLQY